MSRILKNKYFIKLQVGKEGNQSKSLAKKMEIRERERQDPTHASSCSSRAALWVHLVASFKKGSVN